jgi:hypothetical protein
MNYICKKNIFCSSNFVLEGGNILVSILLEVPTKVNFAKNMYLTNETCKHTYTTNMNIFYIHTAFDSYL